MMKKPQKKSELSKAEVKDMLARNKFVWTPTDIKPIKPDKASEKSRGK